METYPSSLSGQQTPKPPRKHGQVPHGPSRSIPGFVYDARIDNATAQQCPHHGIIRTLFRTTKRFQDAVHHQRLVPELVIECRPCNPMVIPVVMHHRQIYPLQGRLSDLSTQIWTRPYLLIRQVVLPIASVHVESSILLRDLMPHVMFKCVVVNQGHCDWRKKTMGR